MRREDFDVWYEKFQPICDNEGSPILYETYGEDLKYITKMSDTNNIWTILDCDGKLYLSPGYHIVNRLNYIVTKNEWNEKTRDYRY